MVDQNRSLYAGSQVSTTWRPATRGELGEPGPMVRPVVDGEHGERGVERTVGHGQRLGRSLHHGGGTTGALARSSRATARRRGRHGSAGSYEPVPAPTFTTLRASPSAASIWGGDARRQGDGDGAPKRVEGQPRLSRRSCGPRPRSRWRDAASRRSSRSCVHERRRRGGRAGRRRPSRGGGRRAPGCGGGPGRAGRCRRSARAARRRRRRPRCRRRSAPAPAAARRRRAVVRPPWFSKPVSAGGRGRVGLDDAPRR